MSAAAGDGGWRSLAVLAPASALASLLVAFCLAAGTTVLNVVAAAIALGGPAAQAWIALGRATPPLRRGLLSALAVGLAAAVTALAVLVVFPRLDTGNGIPGGSLLAFVLVPSLLLLAGGLVAAWRSAPPVTVPTATRPVYLHRRYPHHVALFALWALVGFVSIIAEPVALALTDAFGNDAIAAIAVFVAPPLALSMWLGAAGAYALERLLARREGPVAAL